MHLAQVDADGTVGAQVDRVPVEAGTVGAEEPSARRVVAAAAGRIHVENAVAGEAGAWVSIEPHRGDLLGGTQPGDRGPTCPVHSIGRREGVDLAVAVEDDPDTVAPVERSAGLQVVDVSDDDCGGGDAAGAKLERGGEQRRHEGGERQSESCTARTECTHGLMLAGALRHSSSLGMTASLEGRATPWGRLERPHLHVWVA